MDILKELLFINGKDVYAEYGAFLTEEKAGAHTNYDALLRPPAMKDYVAVSFREQDGEKLPAVLPSPRFEAREVTLYFALMADTKAGFLARYEAFMLVLKSGWLSIRVPELNKTYKMYYKECTGYDQLTYLASESVYVSRFKVKFREPVPTI